MLRRVADFPRPPAVEKAAAPIRVTLGGETIASTDAAWAVLETTHPPTYYLPLNAFRSGALTPRVRRSVCEWKGTAIYYTVIGGGGRTEADAAWGYPDPAPSYTMLRDHVAVYAGRMDACFVGDEQVRPQPGGSYGGWCWRRRESAHKRRSFWNVSATDTMAVAPATKPRVRLWLAGRPL